MIDYQILNANQATSNITANLEYHKCRNAGKAILTLYFYNEGRGNIKI